MTLKKNARQMIYDFHDKLFDFFLTNYDVKMEVDIFILQRIFALQGFKCKKTENNLCAMAIIWLL